MTDYYPTQYYINSGKGISKIRLVAFDAALIDAGIGNYNILKVSSILPIKAKRVDAVTVPQGMPLLTAFSAIDSDTPGIVISSAVGVALPENDSQVGVIMEFSGYCSENEARQEIEEMCKEAMAARKSPIKSIQISSNQAVVGDDGYTSLISAISFW